MPAKRKKDDISKTPEYQKLLVDIEKIIQEAAAQGVDITQRDEILSCRACGAYEDVTIKGEWIICERSGKRLEAEKFIPIDSRERVYHRGRTTHCKMTYDFVCTVCGARQEQVFRDRFEN